MKTSTKVNIIVITAVVAIIGVIVAIAVYRPFSPSREEVAASTSVVAENSHRLTTAEDGKVTFVEFLDFECEVCGAAYPGVESLREEFEGRVTFVVRYFPIPSHLNSSNAAIAVEAAAQQGQFEAMYSKMFTTQANWGESQESQAPLFRTFAEELGLDMAAFDVAVADPATAERVQFDFDAGKDLGVQGTPTFFLNDEMLQPGSIADLRTAIEDALAS